MTTVTLVCSCGRNCIRSCADGRYFSVVEEIHRAHEGHKPCITVSERWSNPLGSVKPHSLPISHGPPNALCRECEGSGRVYGHPSERYEGVKCGKCNGRGRDE